MENNEWIWHFREERERNGISRKAVAAVAGISREYLCRLETGKLPVTDKTRKRLAAALKTLYPDPLNLMIDYVRIRFPTMDARHIIEDVLRLKMKYMAQEDHGLYSYSSMYVLGDVVVMTSPKEENGVLLELKGKGCRQFEAYLDGQQRSWYEFFRQCLDEDAVFKRIDLAVNDRAGIWISPICVINATAGNVSQYSAVSRHTEPVGLHICGRKTKRAWARRCISAQCSPICISVFTKRPMNSS